MPIAPQHKLPARAGYYISIIGRVGLGRGKRRRRRRFRLHTNHSVAVVH